MSKNISKKILSLMVCLSFLIPAVSAAVDVSTTLTNADLIKKKQSDSNKYLTASEAYQLVKNNANEVLFIDVRTPAEVEFVGWTPLVDAVVPYMKNDFDEWDAKKYRYKKEINGVFPIVFEGLIMTKGLNKDSPVIFMCRSGARSSKAASLATELGYTQAYTMVDGFEGDKAKKGKDKGHRTINGWKNSGLPWDYKVDINRVYFNH